MERHKLTRVSAAIVIAAGLAIGSYFTVATTLQAEVAKVESPAAKKTADASTCTAKKTAAAKCGSAKATTAAATSTCGKVKATTAAKAAGSGCCAMAKGTRTADARQAKPAVAGVIKASDK